MSLLLPELQDALAVAVASEHVAAADKLAFALQTGGLHRRGARRCPKRRMWDCGRCHCSKVDTTSRAEGKHAARTMPPSRPSRSPTNSVAVTLANTLHSKMRSPQWEPTLRCIEAPGAAERL